MTKVQWREFSGIFVEGKKVSLRNVKKAIVETEDSQKAEDEGTISVPANASAV